MTAPVLMGTEPPSSSYSPRARVAVKGGYQGPTGTYLPFTKWWVAVTAPVLEMLVLAKTSLTTRANLFGSLLVALRTT